MKPWRDISVTILASTEMRKLLATVINTPDQNIQLSCLTREVVCKMWNYFFAFSNVFVFEFFHVCYTCSGCFELFCMSSTVSENLPGTSRYFVTYKNSVLIFNHNCLSMLGIERIKRPKQELIKTFRQNCCWIKWRQWRSPSNGHTNPIN